MEERSMKTQPFKPRNVHSLPQPPVERDEELESSAAGKPRRELATASDLPALTFGQLAMLTSVGTPFSATIRRTGPGYTIEAEVGPRRWVLVSTHRKTPRLFFHLDGAARAVAQLKPLSVTLELDEASRPPSLAADPLLNEEASDET
jgi:hypothetical protein